MGYLKKLKKLKKMKKKLKLGVLGCGAIFVLVVLAGVVLFGAARGVVGWLSGVARDVGISLPDIKLPTQINLPREIRLPKIDLSGLPLDPFKLTPQEQIVLGRQVAAQQNLDQNAVDEQQVNEIGNRLVKALPQKYKGPQELGGWEWSFRVIRTNSGTVNAVALPGGKVYLYDGLVRLANGNDSELAAVIGHEIAHVVEEHSAEQLRNAGLLQQAAELLLQNSGGEGSTQEDMIKVLAARMGKQITQMQLSQSAEYQADKIGFELLMNAGYDPKAGLQMMKKLQTSNEKPNLVARAFSTHPPTEKRVARLEELISKP